MILLGIKFQRQFLLHVPKLSSWALQLRVLIKFLLWHKRNAFSVPWLIGSNLNLRQMSTGLFWKPKKNSLFAYTKLGSSNSLTYSNSRSGLLSWSLINFRWDRRLKFKLANYLSPFHILVSGTQRLVLGKVAVSSFLKTSSSLASSTITCQLFIALCSRRLAMLTSVPCIMESWRARVPGEFMPTETSSKVALRRANAKTQAPTSTRGQKSLWLISRLVNLMDFVRLSLREKSTSLNIFMEL